MNNTKEPEIEEGDLVALEENLEICHEKVANSSGSCRKRTLQLEHGDVCGRSTNITGGIKFIDFFHNDPNFTYKNKFGKETETNLPDSDQISTELNVWVKPGFLGCKKDKESDINVQKLKQFSYYTPEEEEFERVSQVSTKLKLYEDPWKIKKVLRQSECETFYRLMFGKEVLELHVLPWIKIDEKILEGKGQEFKVWDYDTKTEHVLKLEKWTATYVFTYWKKEFVKRRGLKSGDEIGMFWNIVEDRFWFRVLASDRPIGSCAPDGSSLVADEELLLQRARYSHNLLLLNCDHPSHQL